ncbi:disulfide isomerase [Blastocystis sp. subtype 4]|uniref:disulfide isomerase n=1 Tax=Blastocystis sp. subtype 4 TaxID=944170 RepID=UPI00071164BE|nr:disulfide isomerase [Blastocystis sp. subtype 4]KNB45677.1 disulfide isomerase [Blastocystis sp. subtype 4]|eukprot:XP_014529119.1 disulfide isomerase [Blastocystis sp. subtype 4]
MQEVLGHVVIIKDCDAREINELEPEDMKEFFSDESERYLVVAFRGSQCPSCRWQLYYPNLLTYFFEKENDLKMIFGAIDTDKVPEAAEFCDVDPESAKLELRLITKGGTRCVQHFDSESLTDFITEATGMIPKKSYVKFLNKPLYEKMKEDKSVSHFIEIMSPFERACYDFSIQVEKAAESFAMEPSIDFGRIDCSLMHDLCEELNVGDTPSMLFLPAENVEYNHTFPRLPTVDSIVLFLNEHLGTHRVVDGGLDETYGRDAVLDELAEQFLNGNVETRQEIMHRVRKERKLYKNSAIYYSIMKDIIANDPTIIYDRINSTVYTLDPLPVTDEKYAPTVARLNILHQFEPIETTRSIIMHSQNVDRVLNGKRNVLVLFYDFRCPECREFAQVYRDAFAKHPLNVYFASVNAARYETIRLRFNITDHPVIRYFREGEPLENNVDIPERTADGIIEWLNNELARAQQEKKEKEEKTQMELASDLDDEEVEEVASENLEEQEL